MANRNSVFHNKTLAFSGGQTGNLPNFVLCTLNKTLASQSGQLAIGQTGTPSSTTRPSPFGGHNQAIGQTQKQELCLPQAISHPSALHKTKTLASTVGTQRPLAKQDPCLLVGTLQTSLHTSATSQTGTWFSTQVIDHSNSENGIIIGHQIFTTHMGLKQRQSTMD